MRGPGPAENDIVLAIEEVGRVAGVERHGLKAGVRFEGGAGPLPNSTKGGLTRELTTPSRGHSAGVPVGETDVCAGQVDEQVSAAAVRRGG